MSIRNSEPNSTVTGAAGIRRYTLLLAIVWTMVLGSFVPWYYHAESERLLANAFIWAIGVGVIGFGSRKIIRKTSDIEASEEKYRSLVNSLREIIFQIDAEGNWVFLNPAWTELTGHPVAETIGTSCLLHQHPDDRQSSQEEFRAVVEGRKELCKREIRFFSLRGDIRWFEAHARPAVEGERIVGIHGTLVDITEHKKSEDLFRNTFDQAAVGICHVALDGTFLRVNQRLCTLLGYTERELRAVTFQEVTLADDMEVSRELYRRLLEDGAGIADMEKRYIRKDGSIIWVNLTISLVRNLSDQPDYFISVVENISKRKAAETALRKSEKFLSTIIDTEPECIKLLTAEGTIKMMNKAGLAMIEAEAEDQVRGYSAYPLVSPEYRDAFRDTIDSVFQGKSAHLVFQMVGLKGRRLWLETHAVPLRNDEGAIVALLGITRDVTERRQTEAALRESEEHFHQIFDQTNDAIVLFRMDTFTIYDINPAAGTLFGVSKEEVRNLKPWVFITPLVFRDFIRAIPVDDQSRDFLVEKAQCFTKDGTRITISIQGKIIKLNDEYLVFCSIRDIGEKVRLEGEIRATQAKLIHTNKMTSLGMLVSGIAHEVNNPNHYISVNTAMLADAWQDASLILNRFKEENGDFLIGGLPFTEMQELAPRLFNGIAEGSRRINAIITNMRNFVKDDKSGLQGTVDINRLVRSAESILWHHIHKNTGNFRTHLQEDLPPVRGNSQQIEQVIINLIMNALQALPNKDAGIMVSTTTDPEDGAVVIEVRDEGKGMKRKVLERLKEPFFTTKLDSGGTGLGLYISDSIIAEHNGVLEFTSVLASGTTATIRLPALTAPTRGSNPAA